MILENKTITLKMKRRAKGAPTYAETGDMRKVTINGKPAQLVLNPKEGNTSKRIGLAYGKQWYIMDDADTHKKVKALGAKATTAFTIREKVTPAKKTKEAPTTKQAAKQKDTQPAKQPQKPTRSHQPIQQPSV